MTKIISFQILSIFSFYTSFAQQQTATRYKFSDSILNQLSLITKIDNEILDFGVEISFSVNNKTKPEAMLGGEINAKATPMDSIEFNRCKRIILMTLKKYPIEVIKSNLTKVYVFNTLEFAGLRYGGTYHNSIIYLTRGAWANVELWLEQSFHHEFSSILLNNYSFLFNKSKWISCNNDIQYGGGGFEAIKQGMASRAFNAELNKRGILAEYGTASIEEDFNSFAENLFVDSPQFLEIEKSQIRIRNKMNLFIRFYNQIDSASQSPKQTKFSRLTNVEAKRLIDSLYYRLVNGESFTEMAKKYSKDPGSARNGGKYNNIKIGEMAPEFEKVVLSLKLSEISKPFKTPYGYHIIQLLKRKGMYYSVRHILVTFKE